MNELPGTPPLVSVVIPCFNAERTLPRTLCSVRNQSYRPIEIIAVDDASRDGTLQLLHQQQMPELVVIARPRNGGPAAARNTGVAAAHGEFVAFVDNDDEWHPGKLERQMRIIAGRPEMTMIGCRAEEVTLDATRVPVNAGRTPPVGRDAWRTMLLSSFYVPSDVVARTAAVRRIGGFNERLRGGEDDQDLFIRLALEGEVGFVDEVLVTLHKQPESFSTTNISREHETVLPMIVGHCRALSARLGRAEMRAILGVRYSQVGRNVYRTSPLTGLPLLARAICYGAEPATNLYYVLTAAPWSQRLKRWIAGRRGGDRPPAPSKGAR
jgi:glycosyltransferase involved in cell wall biosynthesis